MLRTRIQTMVAACASSSLPRVEHLVASQHAGGACKRLEDPAVPAASGTGHFCCFFHCQPAAPPQRHASMSSKHTGTVGGDKTPETIQEADDVMNALYDIANILDTGLDRETLSILVGLCETGVNPEALAAVVKELQKESSQVATDHSN